jgi:hypothetical protein
LSIKIEKGTGRKTCNFCHKKIEKDKPYVHFFGWNISENSHPMCIIKWIIEEVIELDKEQQ